MALESVYLLAELKRRVIKTRGELRSAINLLNSARAAREQMFKSGNYAPHEIDTEIQSRLDAIQPIVDVVAADFKTGTANSTPTTRINWDHAVFYFPGLLEVVKDLDVDVDIGGTTSAITPNLLPGKDTSDSSRATSGFSVGDLVKIENATDPLTNGVYAVTVRNITTGRLTFGSIMPGADQAADGTMTLLKVQR